MDIKTSIQESIKLWNFRNTEQVAKTLDLENFSISTGVMIILLFTFISIAISILPLGFYGEEIVAEISFLQNLSLIIMMLLLLVGSVFISLLVIPFYFLGILWNHLWIKLFKGEGNFSKTFKVFVITSIPYFFYGVLSSIFSTIVEFLVIIGGEGFYLLNLLLSPISLAIFVYYCVIIVKTVTISHNMNVEKAILAGICSFLGFFIISFIAIIFAVIIGMTLVASSIGYY